ncbi:MAG: hypothetical protein J6R59_09665 [Paludibacteraceae bacterium]|nr:hypothetical protein [Paludibacteraceae bacterium]
MKNIKTGTYFHKDETYNFEFATDLSIVDKAKFVNSVVDLVVDDLEKKYNFILRDLIVDYYTIKYFTDIDTTKFEESLAFVDDVEQFLEETNIVEIVKANASPTLFDELNEAIDKSIEYITGIHPNPLNEALASLISALEKKVNEFDMGSMMDMAQKFASMTDEFNLDNVMNAYMNSDMHKANLDEIAKSKKSKKNKKNEIKIDESLGEAVRAVVEENKAEKAEVVE